MLNPEIEDNLLAKGLSCAFIEDEIQRIMEIILEYTTKNKE